MKIAVLVETFPSSKEVPILNQICGLIDAGSVLDIFAFNKEVVQVHPKYDKYNLFHKTSYIEKRPTNKYNNIWLSRISLLFDALPKLIVMGIVDPKLLLSSFNKKKYNALTRAFFLFYLARFFRTKKNNKYDIIYCQFAPLGVIGIALWDMGVLNGQVVTAFRGYGINVYPKTMPKGYYDLLISKGHGFTSNSYDTLEGAVKLGFPRNKIHLIHSTLSCMEFPFKERSLQENEEVKLLSVGSLVPVKGHEYLIKALNVLRHDHPEVKFNLEIVGDGELKEELENLIIDLSLENYVTLSGFKTQNELIHIYLNAHLFIHPSIETNTGSKEAQGLVIQEAQATGLPVIASRIGGIPEGLIENKTGILVNEKDIEGLKNAVLEMLDRSNQWGEMGRKGRIFVEQEFDVVFQTNKLIEVFNKTLE